MKFNTPTTPFDFGRAIFYPFKVAPGSGRFTMRLAAVTAVIMAIWFFIVGRFVIGGYIELIMISMNPEYVEDPTAIFGALAKIAPAYMALMFGTWLLWTMTEAAFHRYALNGEHRDGGWFHLRFNGDMWRVMLAQLVVYLVAYAAMIVAAFAFAIIMGLLISLFAMISEALAGVVAVLLVLVMYVVMFGGMALIGIKLAPAAALSVYTKDIQLFSVWPVTKGKFWPMLGAYVVVYILVMLVAYFVLILILAGLGLTFMPDFMALEGMSDSEVMASLTEAVSRPLAQLAIFISLVLYCFVTMLYSLCFTGVGTYAAERVVKDEAVPVTFN